MATQSNSAVGNIQHSQSASVPTTSVKNVTLGAAGQPGVLTVVGDNNQNTFEDNYITREGLRMDLSDTGTFSQSMADNDWVVITATLTGNSGGRLLAMPSATLYEGSVAAGNELPDGSNVNDTDWSWHMWIDWGDSDNNNVVHKTYVTNVSGLTKTIVYRINFRSITELASL